MQSYEQTLYDSLDYLVNALGRTTKTAFIERRRGLAWFLINQMFLQEVTVTSSIQNRSNELNAKLEDCFPSIDRSMFRDSSNVTSVTGFIFECIDDIVPKVTVHTYSKQKPWITGNIDTELKARAGNL